MPVASTGDNKRLRASEGSFISNKTSHGNHQCRGLAESKPIAVDEKRVFAPKLRLRYCLSLRIPRLHCTRMFCSFHSCFAEHLLNYTEHRVSRFPPEKRLPTGTLCRAPVPGCLEIPLDNVNGMSGIRQANWILQ